METKDIQSLSTETTEENTIRLMFNSPALKNKILIIVEGYTDKKLYGYFFNTDVVEFFPHNSCDGIPNLLRKLNVDFIERCFAIKDADFDNLNKVSYTDLPNLFLTDAHDIEMMVLNQNAVERINSEFLDNKYDSCLKDVVDDLQWLSYLKWCNIVKKFCLAVKCFSNLGSVYTGLKAIELENCKNKLYEVSGNYDKCPDIISEVSEFRNNNTTDDLSNLTNGHDVCAALSIYIKAHTSQSVGRNEISRFIRAAYTFDAFKQTKLYTRIKLWESNCKLNFFKSV